MAAAVQFAIFPVCFGAATVIGLPGKAVLLKRLASFAINIATISGAAIIAYISLGLKKQELRQSVRAPDVTRASRN